MLGSDRRGMPRLASLTSMALVALAAAGCAQDEPASAPPQAVPDTQYEDDTIRVEDPNLPREAPEAGERTLDAVPKWRLGEWWTYSMTDHLVGATVEFTRVVAGSERENYLVGFPAEAFDNSVMILHVPGYGDIARHDLSFEVHDAVYQGLKFPLRAGDSWDMSFEGRSGRAEVVGTDGNQATIVLQGQGFNITTVYDAEMGEVVRFEYPGYADYEVTGHGFHYEGLVRVPHDHDLVFFHGRVAGAVDVSHPLIPPTADGPLEEVTVDDAYDRLSFVILLGPRAISVSSPASPGYFSEKATAPDGTVYELAMLPHEGDAKVAFHGHESPGGQWALEHVALGVGAAFIEGIGYHSIDIDLPSGCVVASANAAHHAADCRVQRDGSVTNSTAAA